MIRRLLDHWFPKVRSTAMAQPGFYPPGDLSEPTAVEKVICMKAFGNPAKLELLRAIAWHELFGQGEVTGTISERAAFCEAYEWYINSHWRSPST